MVIPDNYSQWERHEAEQARWLASRPICCRCKEHIQDDPVYHPDVGMVCPECWDELMYMDEDQEDAE